MKKKTTAIFLNNVIGLSKGENGERRMCRHQQKNRFNVFIIRIHAIKKLKQG